MNRADQLKRYRQRLDASAKWRKTEGLDDLWNRLIDLYRNKHFKANSSEDRIAIGVAFGTINVIYPSVSVNHPKITVGARDPEDHDKACILEAVINYWWRHFEVKPQFQRATKDFLILGHGWLKTGYRFVEEEAPLGEEERTKEFNRLTEEADSFAIDNPEMADTLPTDDEIASSVPETKQVVVEDRPFAERVSPFDVFVDPEATSMEDVSWIAQRIVRPIEEVKADPRYRPGVAKKVAPDQMMNRTYWDADKEQQYGDDIKRVTVWEFYDVKAGTMSVFTQQGDGFLVDPTPMPYKFGHPFVMLRNYDVPDHFYPIGDLEVLEPLNLELDKTRSQMMNARKRYARKYLYKEEAFDAESRAALEDTTDGRMVKVAGDFDLAEVVAPMPQTDLPPEFYNQSQIIESDMDKVSGVSEYQRGGSPEIRRTATEASMIQDAVNARAADKLAVVEGTISAVAENLVQLAQQYLTEEGVARVTGNNGYDLWVPFEPEDIQGEFDFEVEGGSTQPNNETFRRQQALDLLQAMAPFMSLPVPVINPKELARHVLQNGFGIKNPEKFLGVDSDPMAQLGDPALAQDPMAGGMPPDGMPPPEEGGPQGGPPPVGVPPPPGGPPAVPPEVLAQLQGQVGFNPQHLGSTPYG